MFSPWQMHQPASQMRPMQHMIVPMRHSPLMETAAGAFPVPESLSPNQFPPAVRDAITRIFEGPPKPAVTLKVMNQAQSSMIAPDLPFKANV